MLELIVTFIWFIMKCSAEFVWWVLSWLYPVVIMAAVVGIPLWLLYRKGKVMNVNQEMKYRLTPQKPAFYINSFGHRVQVDADAEMEGHVRSFLKDNDLTEKDL
ncbi:hypothetical protein KAR91_16260 [Candidatus Pacearchaeota archaeon]|nr:hypothetical protein [Candidatus Pacearchaeota archaeon]